MNHAELTKRLGKIEHECDAAIELVKTSDLDDVLSIQLLAHLKMILRIGEELGMDA